MLIIQRGFGCFIYLIGLLGFIFPPVITRLTISDPHFASKNYWIMGVGLIIGGIINIKLGGKLDQRDENNRKKHHFFFLNFKEWGIIFTISGVLIILIFLIKLFFLIL